MAISFTSKPLVAGCFFVTFLVGLFAGVLWRGDSPAPAAGQARTSPPAVSYATPRAGSSDSSEGDLRLEILSLKGKIAVLESEKKTDEFSGRLALFEKYPNSFYLQTFGEELKLGPEIVDALNLTPDEQESVEKALFDARTAVRACETRHVKIIESTSEKSVAEIPTYPEGKAIRENFIRQVIQQMGERRAKIFLSKSESVIQTQFSGFGEVKTLVEVEYGPSGNYSLKETYNSADGRFNGSTTRPMGGNLPERYRQILSFADAPQ